MRLVFDVETDGFLNHLTKIHCIAAVNADNPDQTWVFNPGEIEAGVELLQSAKELIGHNILAFDIPALEKVYPTFNHADILLTDTLVLSRLIHSDLRNEDYATPRHADDFPKKMYGSHSLKAWGVRLGIHKGDFGEQTDWSEWTQSMSDYCLQDVKVNHVLWEALAPHKWSFKAIRFEHTVAELCSRIGNAGWTFDTDKAASLYAQLSLEQSTIEDELQTLFPNWYLEEEFIPKVNNSKLGYEKGVPFIKQREVVFNPNSRKHIEYCLRKKYGWKPKNFTVQGDAKIDETILAQLRYPEAQKLSRSFMLQKRLGALAEGKYAYMALVDGDGKLRHTINPMGTVTGRASSFAPNLQQVVSTRAEYGLEVRQLFTVPNGFTLVGSDLSGIELRCLAHFLQDGGKYADTIMQGDIHTQNMHDMGLTDRNQAKTAIYCLIFGGGDSKLGEVVGGSAKEGRQLRDAFYRSNPAFKELTRQLKAVVESRGHLIGLDGRKLPVRGHAHLNVLLQSAAALISKAWIKLIDEEIKHQQLDATIIAWVHDEVQIQTKGDPHHVGNLARRMAQEAGRYFNFSIPIDAEYSVGATWADTH
jgi:hypothetical protein